MLLLMEYFMSLSRREITTPASVCLAICPTALLIACEVDKTLLMYGSSLPGQKDPYFMVSSSFFAEENAISRIETFSLSSVQ